jgi:carbohydrate kinase (thermoresistant glucokinase family)
MVIVVMGPSGCGKTTVGQLLASRLGWEFYDGDDFHSRENVEKMASGIPLTDADREPWLNDLAQQIRIWIEEKRNTILACSALKSAYRERLGIDQQSVVTLYLQGTLDLLAQRLRSRTGHYMNPDLLTSQLETLEAPSGGMTISIVHTPDQIVEKALSALQSTGQKE